MTDGGVSLRGRNGILSLVNDCVRQSLGTERPVIMMVGSKGSGASNVHTAIMSQFGRRGRRVPLAYLNFESGNDLLPRYALALIARHLERKIPEYRSVRFPRLILGLLASDQELQMANRGIGRRDIKSMLHGRLRSAEKSHGDYLSAFVTVAGNALGLPPGTPEVVATLMRDAGRGRLPFIFNRGLRWYKENRLVPNCTDPWDTLVELNQWRHTGDERQKAALDRVLFAAFLTDLWQNADRHLSAHSFLVLLDNCQTNAGQRFLDLMVYARHDAVVNDAPCDPLVVVGSTHRWLRAWGTSTGDQWPWIARAPDQASLGDWTKRRSGHESNDSWWYPIGLRDLTLDEVRTRIDVESPRHADLAPFVHRLTCGLPWAVHRVLEVLDLPNPSVNDPVNRDLWLRDLPNHVVRTGPDRPEFLHHEGHTLVRLALDHMLGDFPAEQRAALARSAAARDLSVGIQVLAGGAVGDERESLFNTVRARWLLFSPEGSPPGLHPWLRRLLLWELATEPEEWKDAHHQLTEQFDQSGDDVEAMYHRLASGETNLVVEFLVDRFHQADAADWVDEFDLITSAPNRLRSDREPLALLADLTPQYPEPAVTAFSIIRSLVVARWIWSDPLGDPGMRLGDVIASKFNHLAELKGSDIVTLYNQADRYRSWRHPPTCADGW